MISDFKSGDRLQGREFRDRLNQLVGVCNQVMKMTGDSFIGVRHTSGGLMVGLNLGTLLPRIPKAGWVPIGGIIMWSGAVVDIKSNWALCDGGEYCIEHGIKDHDHAGTITTPDLRGRFAMGIDEDGYSGYAGDDGDGAETVIGATGGHRWHGQSENNHPRHVDHLHDLDGGGGTVVDTNGDGITVVIPGVTSVQRYSSCEAMHLRHGGIVGSWGDPMTPVQGAHTYKDTDNRPRYYALAFIQRIR